MNIQEALEKIICDGIDACKKDYKNSPDKLKGSVSGFEACRGLTPEGLKNLLSVARTKTHEAFCEQVKNYWEIRCFELEIEWVCNVVSAILMNNGYEAIITPTYRGVMKAAEIVGVKDSND